ncbi:IS256 family transposase, partial [Maledivibacter halophilus]
MQNFNNLTVKELAQNCKTVDEIQEAIKIIFRETIQEALEGELEHHLGYSKNDPNGNNSGNSRNGYSKKVIQTNFGKTDLKVPRDRNGEFEPKIIEKYERTTNRIEDQIIAMYAKGMSTRDIEDHMKDIYGIDVSPTMVSKITDKIIPKIQEWQSRPLERVYPIVFLDAIHFKVRKENRVVSKA